MSGQTTGTLTIGGDPNQDQPLRLYLVPHLRGYGVDSYRLRLWRGPTLIAELTNGGSLRADVAVVAGEQLTFEVTTDLTTSYQASVESPFILHRVGDVNCDGAVNFEDINAFVLALADPELWQATYPDCLAANADINGDGVVDFADISPFVALLSGQ